MKPTKRIFSVLFGVLMLTLALSSIYHKKNKPNNENLQILSHEINPKEDEIVFFLKDENGNRFKSLGNLKNWLKKSGKELVFAMNGGMFDKNFLPVGLFIEKGKTISKIETKEDGYGNFYLQPNGILFITKENKGQITETKDFVNKENIEYATQSGPMLISKGKIHSKFNKESKNLNIRNGVGILPNGNLLFAMSKNEINFYNFATYFLEKGCKNALYLDGFVSKTYLPEKNWHEEGGDFGIIIGQIKK